jgi:putative ubiquitin-RnfH superfamily antitoxin RatB of RatAB toxin-antitoxin module
MESISKPEQSHSALKIGNLYKFTMTLLKIETHANIKAEQIGIKTKRERHSDSLRDAARVFIRKV